MIQARKIAWYPRLAVLHLIALFAFYYPMNNTNSINCRLIDKRDKMSRFNIPFHLKLGLYLQLAQQLNLDFAVLFIHHVFPPSYMHWQIEVSVRRVRQPGKWGAFPGAGKCIIVFLGISGTLILDTFCLDTVPVKGFPSRGWIRESRKVVLFLVEWGISSMKMSIFLILRP